MKILILSVLILSNSAQASYFATFCSNAKKTISYESGHNSNSITFQDDEIARTVSLAEVTIDTLENLTVAETTEHKCGYFNTQKNYVAKLKITDGNRLLTDYFICEYRLNSRAPCP